jgi:hypothetical protein
VRWFSADPRRQPALLTISSCSVSLKRSCSGRLLKTCLLRLVQQWFPDITAESFANADRRGLLDIKHARIAQQRNDSNQQNNTNSSRGRNMGCITGTRILKMMFKSCWQRVCQESTRIEDRAPNTNFRWLERDEFLWHEVRNYGSVCAQISHLLKLPQATFWNSSVSIYYNQSHQLGKNLTHSRNSYL